MNQRDEGWASDVIADVMCLADQGRLTSLFVFATTQDDMRGVILCGDEPPDLLIRALKAKIEILEDIDGAGGGIGH